MYFLRRVFQLSRPPSVTKSSALSTHLGAYGRSPVPFASSNPAKVTIINAGCMSSISLFCIADHCHICTHVPVVSTISNAGTEDESFSPVFSVENWYSRASDRIPR